MATKAAYLTAIAEAIPDPGSRLRQDLEAVVNETAPWEPILRAVLVGTMLSGGQRLIGGEDYDSAEVEAILAEAMQAGLVDW